MIEYKKYFIVGTNDKALYDTMNGNVTGELIRCKDCKWFYKTHTEPYCALWSRMDTKLPKETDFCSWAERKEE